MAHGYMIGFRLEAEREIEFPSGCPNVLLTCTETDRSCKFVLRPGIYGDLSQGSQMPL
jgi:hypothetical protein